MFDKKRVVNF